MPSVSRAQHAFAAMSQSPKGRAQLKAAGMKPMPVKVGKEFLKADTGKHFPVDHVKKGKPQSRSMAQVHATRR